MFKYTCLYLKKKIIYTWNKSTIKSIEKIVQFISKTEQNTM